MCVCIAHTNTNQANKHTNTQNIEKHNTQKHIQITSVAIKEKYITKIIFKTKNTNSNT